VHISVNALIIIEGMVLFAITASTYASVYDNIFFTNCLYVNSVSIYVKFIQSFKIVLPILLRAEVNSLPILNFSIFVF
jgi:hypothetical protein